MSRTTCARCKREIAGARVVLAGWWCCPDCAYAHDYGRRLDEGPVAEHLLAARLPAQTEHLFPLPPKVRKRER
jgi:hypothetical protein